MTNFTGTLNVNAVYAALYNAYRIMGTLGDQLEGLNDRAGEFKIDGGQYYDQLKWTFSDVLPSREFDPDDANVLAPEAKAPLKEQKMVVDKVRTIGLYMPTSFLTKQAWMSSSYFDEFQGVVESQIGKTRKLYDQRIIDVYLGTTETAIGNQTITIELPTNEDPEKEARLRAQLMARTVARTKGKIKDSTRDYNDLGIMTSYSSDKLKIYWNAEFYDEILYTDLPTIYHKDNLLAEGETLEPRYFGHINATSGKAGARNTTIRSLLEGDFATSGGNTTFYAKPSLIPAGATNATHVLIGDLIPNNASYEANTTYTVDPKIICKIVTKDAIKYLSAVETQQEFFNPKNMSRNHYLHFMYGGPDRLGDRPLVTIKAK